jgi:glycosyltransferase involved in cell wall biosynthesis
MRIVHVITRLIIGGAQENTILTCAGLQGRGHEVHLLSGPTTGPEGSLVDQVRRSNYVFEELPDLVRQVSPVHDWRALRAMRRRFEALQPDVVHTHSSKAGVLGRIAAHQARVPLIVHTIHGMSFNRTQSKPVRMAYAAAERYCAKRCHAIVSVADAMTTQALAAGIGQSEQYETIRSGMRTEEFDPAAHDATAVRRAWGFDNQAVVVGTVARLFFNKGYEQLIEIMAVALAQQPNLRFVWIGDGAARGVYEEELRRRALWDRVVLTGLLPPTEMPRVLSGIDILAHTSQWEGLPRAVVQALLMEKPAVSFAIDGAPEVVRPGQTGELAHLNDTHGFAEALVGLARDRRRRIESGQNGRRLCLAEFDHRVMVDRLDRLYRRLAGKA